MGLPAPLLSAEADQKLEYDATSWAQQWTPQVQPSWLPFPINPQQFPSPLMDYSAVLIGTRESMWSS